MQCLEFEAVLEQAGEQPLPAEASAHLAECESCRFLAADLETIAAAARELTQPDEDPPARVWLQLRGQLEADGVIRAPQTVKPSFGKDAGWLSGLLAWMRRPALVATYAAFMVLAAGLAWEHSTPELDNRAEPPSDVASATQNDLNNLEAQTMSDLPTVNPEADAALRRDLKVVDNFIAVCEKAVREEPQDETTRQYLYGAYQQKSELLAAATAHGRTGE